MVTEIEYLKAKSLIVEYENQQKCEHDGLLIHKTEYNCFPYGDNIEYDICNKCGEQINFKTF